MMEKYGVDDVKGMQQAELEKVSAELMNLIPGEPDGVMSKEASQRVRVLRQRQRQLQAAVAAK